MTDRETSTEILLRLTRRQATAVDRETERLEAAIDTNEWGDYEGCSVPCSPGKRGHGVRITILDGWRRGGYPKKHVEYRTCERLEAALERLDAAKKLAKKTQKYKAALKRERAEAAAADEAAAACHAEACRVERERLAGIGCSTDWIGVLMQTRAGRFLRENGREMYDGEPNREAHDALSYAIEHQSSAWRSWQEGDIYDAGHLISLVVGAHRRHTQTDYDDRVTELRNLGVERDDAREMAREECC